MKNLRLTTIQVVTLTCTSFLPLMFWVYPRLAVESAGVDAQWSVLGTCIIGMYAAWIHGLLNRRFSGTTGTGMMIAVFGKVMGRVVGFLFIPGYVLFLAVSLFSFAIAMKSVLISTPRLATAIALVFVAVMGAVYGLETIARLSAIVFPITLAGLYFNVIFVSFHGHWTNIMWKPVDAGKIVATSFDLVPLYFGLNLLLMLSPYYDRRRTRSVPVALVAVAISSITALLVFLAVLLMVGQQGTERLTHPVQFVLQLAQIHGFLIERLGLFTVFFVTIFESIFLSNHLWALSTLITHLIGFKETRRKWMVFVIAIVVLVLFYLIPDEQFAEQMMWKVLMPLSWLYLLVEPTVKLVMSYIWPPKNLPSLERRPGR